MPERTVRCLLIANTFPPVIGGSSGVYENLARRSQGNILVLTSYLDHRTGLEHAGWREQDARAPYTVERIALVRPPLAAAAKGLGWGAGAHWKMAVELMRKCAHLTKTHGISVVCIADDETVGWLVPFVSFALRRATLIYCHGDDLVRSDGRNWRRRWFALADAVIAASQFASDQLIRNFDVAPSKIALILNGVDCQRFRVELPSPSLQARYRTAGRRVILSASRLVPRKGIDRTLEGLAFVLQRHPDILYLIIGEGEQQDSLQALTAKLGLEHAVQFVGAVPYDEMPAHYALADLVVLPNRASEGDEDGLPLVFLEANACGKPVIGGRAGGTAEVVENETNGLLVDGNDPRAIAQAIDRLLSDPALNAKLAAGALKAAKNWDWETRVAGFQNLCRDVARNGT